MVATIAPIAQSLLVLVLIPLTFYHSPKLWFIVRGVKTSMLAPAWDIELDNAETIDNSVNGTINLGTTTFKLTGGTTIVSDQTTVAL